MSLRKNVASQFLPWVAVDVSLGTTKPGVTPVGLVSKDGAAPATITGTNTSVGGGMFVTSLSQADTNGNVLGFLFTASDMVPVAFTIYTVGYDPAATNIPASVVNNVTVGTMNTHVTVATSGILSQAFVSTALTSIGNQVWAATPRVLTAPVTVAAFSAGALTSAALASDAVSRIGAYVWDVTLGDHNDAGTTGLALDSAGAAGDPWSTSIPEAYAEGTAGNILGTRINTTLTNIGGGAAPTEASIWSHATRLLSADVTVGTMNTPVTIAVSGFPAQGFVQGALTSIGVATWASATRLLTAPVTIASMGGVHVTVATSGILSQAFVSTALTSISKQIWATTIPGSFNANEAGNLLGTRVDTTVSEISGGGGGTAPTEASIWSYTTRLLTADVTVAEINAGVITSAALASDAVSRLTNINAISGVTIAAEKLAESAANMSRGAVGNSSSTVSVVVASITPAIGIADQLKGAVIIFDHDTTTANLRGQRAAITSNGTGVLSVTTLTNAPASGDSFMVI